MYGGIQRIADNVRVTMLNGSAAGYGMPLTANEFEYYLVDTGEVEVGLWGCYRQENQA